MRRTPTTRMYWFTLGALALASVSLMLCSCSLLNKEFIGEVIGGLADIDNPAPTPTPTPPADEPSGKVLYHKPVYKFKQVNGDLPPGVVVCTRNYVPGEKDKGESISVGAVTYMHAITGEMRTTCVDNALVESPWGPTVDNWSRKESCRHWYTTGHVEVNPKADGTRRGRAIFEWREPGPWTFWVAIRATGNRTDKAWLAVTLERPDPSSVTGTYKETYWSKWNQRGGGQGGETYVNVLIAEAVPFVEVAE